MIATAWQGAAGLLATAGGGSGPGTDPIGVLIWVGALILAIVGAGLAVMAVRRRLLGKPPDAKTAAGSWLDELRAMHRRGEMDDEEFQAARASLLAKISGTPIPVRAKPADRGAIVARPGFDLTGAPLPTRQEPPKTGPFGTHESGQNAAPDAPPRPDSPGDATDPPTTHE